MSGPEEQPRGKPEAIVRPRAGAEAFTVRRIAPRPELAEFVDYHWLVRWNVSGTHRQQVVPQPRVHVAAERGRLLVHGITRRRFHRELSGCGLVLGTAFRPAGFRPVLGRPVASIAETARPGLDVLGVDDEPVARRILAGGADDDLVRAMEEYLLCLDPHPDDTARQVDALVARAERDHGIRRAEQLAEVAGLSLRSLQRLFSEYVGVGPKWVIARFRILEAAAAAHAEGPVDWADLAQDLGFSDQAHLVRAFTQVVGSPPASYERDAGARDAPDG